MGPNVNVRTYRLPQASPRAGGRTAPRFSLRLSAEQRKSIAIMVASALLAGLAITQFLHGQIVDMRAGAQQLRTLNSTISTENVRLLAMRAQLASKSHIAALAGTKLNLFEPEKGQVRRM